MRKLSKEEVLSFLLSHIVVEKACRFEMNPNSLFELMNLAAEAEKRVAMEDESIPHEVIEEVASAFIERI
jgi:hypothetical protein